jgi:hypothetical protein
VVVVVVGEEAGNICPPLPATPTWPPKAAETASAVPMKIRRVAWPRSRYTL